MRSPNRAMRSPHDREILRLAIPALGALASEPLYVLVDTAIVGHLGTMQLSALARAGAVLTTTFTIFNFLTYGTTAQVARLHGAGEHERATRLGMQAFWLGLGIGMVLLVALIALADQAVALMGARGEVADEAATYLRISALGAPAFMIAASAQGYLRGISDLRTPLIILVVAQVMNALLEVLFVYGFGWGLEGSAWGTVLAQVGMGLAFARIQARGGWRKPRLRQIVPLMRVGSEIAVRTTALVGSFLIATAVLGRVGDASVSAHQIVFNLFIFMALVLDAIAIAGQVMVGRLLGAGDPGAAREAAMRMIGWSVLAGDDLRGVPACSRRRAAALVYFRSSGDRAGRCDLAAVRLVHAGQRGGVRPGRHPHRRGRHAVSDVGDAGCGGHLHRAVATDAPARLGNRRRLVGTGRADRSAIEHLCRALCVECVGVDGGAAARSLKKALSATRPNARSVK